MKYLLNLFIISLLIISIQNTFLTEIFKEINKEKVGENTIISPLSIYQVLSLLSNGAEKETLKEMFKILGNKKTEELNDINMNKIIEVSRKFSSLEIANAIMTKCEPSKSFLLYAKGYSADVKILESVEEVNNWSNEKTHGKIKKIIEELDVNTVMILLNAVYFKGNWVYPFEKENNKNLPFYNFRKEKKIVETMIQEEYFNYYQNSEAQVIELPYEKDFMSAIIILPSDNLNINNYIETLLSNGENLYELIYKLKAAKVHLELPKFELDFSLDLNEVLQQMGMKLIFDQQKADLSRLCWGYKNLYVDSVIHKAYLKVDEIGSEAAAVSAVIIEESAMEIIKKEKVYKMQVNRPFLFLLKNSRFPKGYDMAFMAKVEKI